MSLNFTLDCDIDETHFISYFTISKEVDDFYKMLNDNELSMDFLYEQYFVCDIMIENFNEIVAKFNRIGKDNNINIFDNKFCDEYKISFLLSGKYKGEVFTIYDYKGDECIHIGGKNTLDIKSLIKELNELIKMTEPLEYKAKYHYDSYNGKEYSY
jgi:hypothetical protein